ncbi:MAG: SH3 domain-containing protein [Chloroflexi bacterium]|nr:SH3 domain-containing protein [Chloroflexota bacterium]MBV9595825.1 SH3 domain-containing protein [Chloroflexota bacterium]
MANLVRAVLIIALLGVPLLVVVEMPRLLDLASSVPAPAPGVTIVTPTPGFSLSDATPTAARGRASTLDQAPPPTLAPPASTATTPPTPRATPTGERIVIANTGGLGAVLRADPVTGRPVAALREQQVLDVLEHRDVPGSGDWLHVRTADGVEGWVTSVVARPVEATPSPPGRG